jgi:hypothetical protein
VEIGAVGFWNPERQKEIWYSTKELSVKYNQMRGELLTNFNDFVIIAYRLTALGESK